MNDDEREAELLDLMRTTMGQSLFVQWLEDQAEKLNWIPRREGE